MENNMAIPQNGNRLPYDWAISSLGIYLQNVRTTRQIQKCQDTKSTYKNQLCFYTRTMNIQNRNKTKS